MLRQPVTASARANPRTIVASRARIPRMLAQRRPVVNGDGWQGPELEEWAEQGSNLRLPACKTSALPLSYPPVLVRIARPAPAVKLRDGRTTWC